MRPRKFKLPLTLESVRFLLGDRRPHTLGELRLSFAEDESEVKDFLQMGVAIGALRYYPPKRKTEARYADNPAFVETVARPREPIVKEGELRYDLFSHMKLCRR
jgi:hypothetical protein